MFNLLAHFLNDQTVTLYALQASTYAVAALVSRDTGHYDLAMCYATSSILHMLLSACHLFHRSLDHVALR